MSEKILISTLKSQLSKHVRAAEAGASYEVMDRARVVARLVPYEHASRPTLETIPPARPFASVRTVRLPRLALTVSSLAVLADARGSR